ncbi:hypothetical protein Tco_1384452 [Tanacetum coccineum]
MRRILRCIAKTYDEVQAGIDADALFVAKLQQKEKEGDFIHLKREKLSKNMGGYEHSQLKAKHLQKIQVKDSIEATGVIAKGFLKNITVLREEVSTPIEPLLRDCYSLKVSCWDASKDAYTLLRSFKSIFRFEDHRPGFGLMIENGSNGVDLLRTPRIRVSGLQGFNSSLEFCSWDFLGPP